MHYFNPCITTILSERVGEAAPSWMAKESLSAWEELDLARGAGRREHLGFPMGPASLPRVTVGVTRCSNKHLLAPTQTFLMSLGNARLQQHM